MMSLHNNRTMTKTEVGTRDWGIAIWQAWPCCLLEEYGQLGDFGPEKQLEAFFKQGLVAILVKARKTMLRTIWTVGVLLKQFLGKEY